MIARFFIDECLSPRLVLPAIAAGHAGSTCLRDRGRLGWQDWEMLDYLLENEFILVTRNAKDFRGKGKGAPGGLLAAREVHAGLICLQSDAEMDLERQLVLFDVALTKVAGLPDLINQALEVDENEHGAISVSLYEIPLPAHAPHNAVT